MHVQEVGLQISKKQGRIKPFSIQLHL